jgi:hypothetical protein
LCHTHTANSVHRSQRGQRASDRSAFVFPPPYISSHTVCPPAVRVTKKIASMHGETEPHGRSRIAQQTAPCSVTGFAQDTPTTTHALLLHLIYGSCKQLFRVKCLKHEALHFGGLLWPQKLPHCEIYMQSTAASAIMSWSFLPIEIYYYWLSTFSSIFLVITKKSSILEYLQICMLRIRNRSSN